jgi:tetratricopeptide (TPR) repeat protein
MEEEKKELSRLRAEACLKAGLYQEAIDVYQNLVEIYPQDDSFLLSLAWAYHDAGDPENAIHCFESLFDKELARGIFTGFAYDELVRIYRAGNQHDRLVDVCKRAAALQPGDAGLLGDLGDAYLKAGRIETAIEVLNRIVSMEPDAAAGYCRLGEAYMAKGDFAQAEAAYDRAAEIDPEKACSFYCRLTDSYLKAGEHERAGKAISQCLNIRGNEPLYHCLSGDCLIGQGKIAEAGSAYETAISLSPGSEGVFLNRWGNSLASARHYKEAIEVFEKAIEKDGNNPFYLMRLSALSKIRSAPFF